MIHTNSDNLGFGMSVRHTQKTVVSELTPSYRVKLGLFALLGHAVVHGILLGSVIVLFAAVVWVDYAAPSDLTHVVLITLIPILLLLLSVLRIRLEKPQGYALRPTDFPELFTLLNDISQCIHAPRIDQVILTSELDITIIQTPKLGLWDWSHHTLVIGLELLLILSPQQANVALIHTLGHYSKKYHGFDNWIYQSRKNWQQLRNTLDRTHGVAPMLLKHFFNWYLPKFNAYSAAVMQASEYQADALAAKMVHRDCVAKALISREVIGPYVDETYWLAFFQQADDLPKPPSPWESLRHYLVNDLSMRVSLKRRLQQHLLTQCDTFEADPSLIDRLAALNVHAELPEPSMISAAEIWFDSKYHRVIRDFDQMWLEINAKRWEERYEYVKQAKIRLKYLRNFSLVRMTDEALWEKAQLEAELGDKDQAILAYRSYQDRFPDHALAAFHLGCYASAAGSDEVLIQMKKALTQADLVIPACQYACEYLARNHRKQESHWWQQQAERQLAIDHQADVERTELADSDQIIAYESDDATSSYLAEKLRETGKITKAWIAQKIVQYYPEYPVLVIVIECNGLFVNEMTLIEQLNKQLHLGCAFFVISKKGPHPSLAKQICALNDRII